MNEDILAIAARLSDDQLLARVKLLANRERDATVELIAHLSELDGRRAHLPEGPGSLYSYCHEILGYSEDAAWNRAATANVVRRYPKVLEWLADGSLNITVVRMLRPVLRLGDALGVLAEARHRSKKEVLMIVARLDPKPDVPSTIRKVGVPVVEATKTLLLTESEPSGSAASATTPASSLAPGSPAQPAAGFASPMMSARPAAALLSPERYRLQFTVSKDTYEKLQRAQNLLCREVPSGDPAAIFERALDLLLHSVEKKKLGRTDKPRAPRKPKRGSRRIPAHVRREVRKRDGGRCAFVGKAGRCTQRRFLEWHHIHPHGHQGEATVANISLRCRAHNVYESEITFGPWIARESSATYAVSREFAPFRNDGAIGGR